jgi:hypothetical protein
LKLKYDYETINLENLETATKLKTMNMGGKNCLPKFHSPTFFQKWLVFLLLKRRLVQRSKIRSKKSITLGERRKGSCNSR